MSEASADSKDCILDKCLRLRHPVSRYAAFLFEPQRLSEAVKQGVTDDVRVIKRVKYFEI